MTPPMPMRCTVERDEGGSDPYNGGEDWQEVTASLRCYWWSKAGREAMSVDRSAVVADEHVIVPRDADVKVGDRLPSVRDRRGQEILDRLRTVEYVAVEVSHLDLSVRSVDG